MKGVVFTEFLEMVESGFGMEVADGVIMRGCPMHNVGFTAVGTYDYQNLIGMVNELSKVTETPASSLVYEFGKHMFGKFLASYPDAFERVTSTFELMARVEDVIHVEVRKLHPDAELPTFTFPQTAEGCLEVVYESNRPLADLAHGLIAACIQYFEEPLEIVRTDIAKDGTRSAFLLRPVQSA